MIAEWNPRHRYQEFLSFLLRIVKVSKKLKLHLIADNYCPHN